MRILIWSSTAMVLLGTAGLFVAARHATQHPDSFVGRCAMTFYRVWNPVAGAWSGTKPTTENCQVAPAQPAPKGPVAAGEDSVEPIVVDPTEEEPPLAFPRLAPEIAAAIERLRNEEESEAPAQPFDGAGDTLRMPYADEDLEVLPNPTTDAEAEDDTPLPGSYGFFFLPPCCLQMVCEKLVESLRQLGDADQADADQANEEAADNGTDDSSNAGEIEQIPYDHYHGNSCPYTGCPYPYRYMPATVPSGSPR